MTNKTKIVGPLPDPFRFKDGTRVSSAADWPKRRREILELILGLEYGWLPPAPEHTRVEVLHQHQIRDSGGEQFISCRVIAGPADRPFAFLMTALVPAGKGPFPVVLNGDACWRFVTDAVAALVVGRGFALAQFNRVELAPDMYNSERRCGLYTIYPEGEFGALSAWAWGYHRCVDALAHMEWADPARIAVVGHSRGGKTVLLAGATDERITITAPNNSGAGGAGCMRWQGPDCETLADSIRMTAYWYGPRLPDFVGREQDLPFDQHFLKALVAPRALLSTEARGDLWANPTGTWQTHLAAREVYNLLGASDKIGTWYRDGGHNHGLADWAAFLDFAEWHLKGTKPRRRFDKNPFPDLPPAFEWSAPGAATG